MSDRLAIIGAGDLGQQIAYYVKLQDKYSIVGYIDDFRDTGSLIDGLPVLGSLSEVEALHKSGIFDFAFIAIGYTHFNLRTDVYKHLSSCGIPLATVISPFACVMPEAKIGAGCWVGGNAFVGPRAVIDDNVLVNGGAQIAHDCYVGKHSFVAGSVVIGGYSHIGERAFLGLHCTIDDHISITDDVVIGSNSVVRKNLDKPGTFLEGKFFHKIYLTGR